MMVSTAVLNRWFGGTQALAGQQRLRFDPMGLWMGSWQRRLGDRPVGGAAVVLHQRLLLVSRGTCM